MSKKNQPKKRGVGPIILILAAAVCIAAVVVWALLSQKAPARPVQTTPTTVEETAGTAAATEPVATVPVVVETQAAINLGYGLEITDEGPYAGVYMEDGSNEVVSDVMMIVVRNNGESDIQLAEITALCGGEEYHFTLTNLAVGHRVVLLDQERKDANGGKLESAVLDTAAVFQEPMALQEDVIQVDGLEGMLNVQNVSDADLDGDIYIYYKYAAEDLYYGGITFRVRIEGGLKAGELRQIPAGHFSPDGCAIVQVTIHE